jgi:hypothetical protein
VVLRWQIVGAERDLLADHALEFTEFHLVSDRACRGTADNGDVAATTCSHCLSGTICILGDVVLAEEELVHTKASVIPRVEEEEYALVHGELRSTVEQGTVSAGQATGLSEHDLMRADRTLPYLADFERDICEDHTPVFIETRRNTNHAALDDGLRTRDELIIGRDDDRCCGCETRHQRDDKCNDRQSADP